jgi:hypothetical protein
MTMTTASVILDFDLDLDLKPELRLGYLGSAFEQGNKTLNPGLHCRLFQVPVDLNPGPDRRKISPCLRKRH